MSKIQFILNDQTIETDEPSGGTVLDFIRYNRHLTGTKIGCREGDCGACTVLVGALNGDAVSYRSMTSCLMPLANAHGKHLVTIEGINPPTGLTPVQQAMVDESGTQCGFCTVGFVMSLTGHCLQQNTGDHSSMVASIDGNICRCTGYKSIERAASRLTALLETRADAAHLPFAVEKGLVPDYFLEIKAKLSAMASNSAGSVANIPQKEALFVGGGTDLYVQREDMAHVPAKNLYDQSALKGIIRTSDSIEMGSAVTVTDLLESDIMGAIFPKLQPHLRLISSTPIRNMATLAGNLANASPIADMAIWLLALNATVVLNADAAREIPLSEFYIGYKKLAKTPHECIEKIRFPLPGPGFCFNFEKVSKRTYLDIASVNSAAAFEIRENKMVQAQISIGGVAAIPTVLSQTASFLIGKTVPKRAQEREELLENAIKILQSEINPISDVRGSIRYKRLLASQLLRAHFIELFPIA